MKHTLITITIMLLFATCKNNPTVPSTTETSTLVDTTSASGIAAIPKPLSSEASALKLQILTDFYAGRAVSHKYDSIYTQYMGLARNIKGSFDGAGSANTERLKKVMESLMAFTNAYEMHRQSTGSLDALATQLTEGKITLTEAQKVYENAKASMLAEAEKLPSQQTCQQSLRALNTEFEGIFSGANKKAAGN